MANLKDHKAVVVPGSVKSSTMGGVEFVVRCCDKHEKSVHIQHPGKHSHEELLRIRDRHLVEVAQEHANHDAAVEFLALSAISNQQSALSQTADSFPASPVRNDNEFGAAHKDQDCGCGT